MDKRRNARKSQGSNSSGTNVIRNAEPRRSEATENRGQIGRKFTLLLWKNYKLQIRNKNELLAQIFLPILFCFMLYSVRAAVTPEAFPNGIDFTPFEIKLNQSVIKDSKLLLWSPCNELLKDVMSDVAADNSIAVKCVDDAATLENEIVSNPPSYLAGVEFNDDLFGSKTLPKNIHITIRFPSELRDDPLSGVWETNSISRLMPVPGPKDSDRNDGAVPSYSQEGFLALQKDISFGIIKQIKQKNNNEVFNPPKITMSRYPYPPYISDVLLKQLQLFLGLILMMSYMPAATYTIRALTHEKETQMKEVMKIMGLPNWLHWTAWFIKSLINFSLVSLIILFVLKFKLSKNAVLSHSSLSILILFITLYVCATITFCFAVSVFFARASTATMVGNLLLFLFYLPYLIVMAKYDVMSHAKKISLCLLSNTALPLGLQIISNFEGQGVGIQWSNLWTTNTPSDTLTLGHVLIMLILDMFIYLFIAAYFEAIFPGQYGVPKPWNFIFTKSYWCGKSSDTAVSDYDDKPKLDPQTFEKEPQDLPVGVQIKHLGKTYRNKKVAVRDLNLNMYKGHITVLLGHNGAGKTTTMSMLTGLYPPTKGTAIINGYDIVTNMDRVRDSLGLCPQYNVIFDELTVDEHLYFFGKLKGMRGKEIKSEIDHYIDLLELNDKKKVQAQKLSGGMKRKLCIANALCGYSKVVLLDEPTAGVDPSARRAVWNLLQLEKKGRTILLSTHFMDEADLLGDRIAIMAGGKLQSCGSSFFLKKKFGIGYRLIIEKNAKCKIDNVTKLLKSFIPKVKFESTVGSELTYVLREQDSGLFKPMLQSLEQNSDSLGIESYGISLTTLEEVFMKVGADLGQEEDLDREMSDHVRKNSGSINEIRRKSSGSIKESKRKNSGSKGHMDNIHYVTGCKFLCNQLFAMFMKRFIWAYRSWISLLLKILIPVLFVVLSMMGKGETGMGRDLPKLVISFEKYESPIALISGTSQYKNAFQAVIKGTNTIIDLGNSDLKQKALSKSEEDISKFRRNYLIGASFDENNIVMWFNNDPIHTPPLALQSALQAVAKIELGEDYGFQFSNYPLPFTLKTKTRMMDKVEEVGDKVEMMLVIAMTFVSPLFIMFYIYERASGAKHLQFVSGARVSIMWLVSYIWDFMEHMVIIMAVIIVLLCFQVNGYKTVDEIGRVLLILVLFTFAILPLTYLASFLFKIPSTGYSHFSSMCMFTGIFPIMVVNILNIESLKMGHIGSLLHKIFLIFPHYALTSALQNMNRVYSMYQMCKKVVDACVALPNTTPELCKTNICTHFDKCCNVSENYYAWDVPGFGMNIIYFLAVGLIGIMLLLLMEYGFFKAISYIVFKIIIRRSKPVEDPEEDSDVRNEKRKIRSKSKKDIGKYPLALKDVTKYYRKFLAVNNLCLAVEGYECFGLLGVNGAGKTTTFQMMTGGERISSGEAWVYGLSLKTRMKDVYKVIGYCPQFDALLEDLTGRETLIIFCLLRGISYGESKSIVGKMAEDFDFSRHINKRVKEYSGGNKRKLSTALAMIGQPEVIYLDEPTAGMDPATKRHIWNNINKVRDNGKSIILTSHSMEECEALCTRIAIMVNGNFKCLGSVQHLKNKFSQGYTLIVKVKKSGDGIIDSKQMGPITKFVKRNFPSAELQESYQELLSFYIPSLSKPLSEMFGIMEQGKKDLNIEDYSLGQCSLEQVFLGFTKYQTSKD